MQMKVIDVVDCHFKNLVLSDFPVKQNRQKLILIPSFKSHKDLTQFISNRTALSGKKDGLFFQYIKGNEDFYFKC